MFSLIITIISIALVAALALATIYYGGSAFSKGGEAAKASQLINEGQQLQGARTLSVADGKTFVEATGIADLIADKYLSQAPSGWTVATGTFVSPTIPAAACQEVNKKAGFTAADTAAAADTNDALVVVAADTANKVYACVANQVVYKF